ncbi:aminotransferase class V-fold PLP-dependent enzyme [Vibrio sp. Of14-4]|uniref:aminotransferase class V-fold PLP-dependent enzyme n=1 Tax=Vibrio sp. Of14-4 TaxID=2724878 RepID=UPI001EF27F69|nr:aminotransferase class V-fold PLP-dependent enzyme [Vibrio sp. Of14-4]MCG7491029.1 aminotransferase class V-fold PLP-dependent enzyme [Vibrio sp. Of14-4]
MTIPFNIRRARSETLAADSMIHFDNAGSSLMPTPVSESLHQYLNDEEKYGGYETAELYTEKLNNFYNNAAKLLNCSANEIAFVDSATRAWDLAFYSFKFQRGDKILTSMAEYGSNVIAYIQQAKRYGVNVVFIPNDCHGQVDTQMLSSLIDERVKLISITHIPTGGGLVNPVNEIGRIAKAANIPYLLDSCQALGQIPVDVEKIGCDILSGTGRKYLRGPRGTGLLYVRTTLLEKLEPPMLDQHAATLMSPTEFQIRSDAKRFENWEQFCAGKIALGEAIKYSLDWGLPDIQARIYTLANTLRERLKSIKEIAVTDQGIEQCGIVTFYSNTLSANAIQKAMRIRGINVSISKGAGSLISFSDRGLEEVVRASLHYYNTIEEIDTFIQVIRELNHFDNNQ